MYLGRRVEATRDTGGSTVGRRRVLELAADGREAAQEKGARSTSTSASAVEPTRGLELDKRSKEESRDWRRGVF
jgi:hypothetical protein